MLNMILPYFDRFFVQIIVVQCRIVAPSNQSCEILHGPAESRYERVFSNYIAIIRAYSQKFES